jgi:hypothetical protein
MVIAETQPPPGMCVVSVSEGDLNPESREISQNLGNFHVHSIATGCSVTSSWFR